MEMLIGAEDAAFLVGTGGKTKDKVARVAGARLDLLDADVPGNIASRFSARTKTVERRSSTSSGSYASAWGPSRSTRAVPNATICPS